MAELGRYAIWFDYTSGLTPDAATLERYDVLAVKLNADGSPALNTSIKLPNGATVAVIVFKADTTSAAAATGLQGRRFRYMAPGRQRLREILAKIDGLQGIQQPSACFKQPPRDHGRAAEPRLVVRCACQREDVERGGDGGCFVCGGGDGAVAREQVARKAADCRSGELHACPERPLRCPARHLLRCHSRPLLNMARRRHRRPGAVAQQARCGSASSLDIEAKAVHEPWSRQREWHPRGKVGAEQAHGLRGHPERVKLKQVLVAEPDRRGLPVVEPSTERSMVGHGDEPHLQARTERRLPSHAGFSLGTLSSPGSQLQAGHLFIGKRGESDSVHVTDAWKGKAPRQRAAQIH
jgi:hypothetical protein